MENGILVCLYCGDTMDALTKEQVKVFGKPKCCEKNMIEVDSERIYKVIGSLDKIKEDLENRTIDGTLNEM